MCEHLKAHANMLETRAAIRGEHPTAHKTKRAPGAAVTSTDVVDGSTNGPKWDKTCHNCNKVGHMARFCPALSSKERKALQEKYVAKRKGKPKGKLNAGSVKAKAQYDKDKGGVSARQFKDLTKVVGALATSRAQNSG